jgi:hypothetical protein
MIKNKYQLYVLMIFKTFRKYQTNNILKDEENNRAVYRIKL